MKTILVRLSLAAALTLAVVLLESVTHAQAPNSQSQSPQATSPQPSTPANDDPTAGAKQNEPQMPTANDATTPAGDDIQKSPAPTVAQTTDVPMKDMQAFAGTIVSEDGKVVLKDPVTKTTYRVRDVAKTKAFMGKQVKITGKLDPNSNVIHIIGIEPIS